MKIVLVCWGSTGDVYPVLALSERLLERGHQVRVCAPAIYREKILEVGAEFYEVGVAFDLAEFHVMIDTLITMRDPIAPLLLLMKEGVFRHGEKWYRDCLTAMKGFDIAICHSVDIPGQEAAIRNELPWMTVTYCPGFIKTLDDAPYPFPNWGPTFNSIWWKLIGFRLRHTADSLFNEFIASVGGKARASVTSEGIYSPHLNLIAASPTLCPPTNFSPNHRFTGIWHLAQPSYVPPPEFVDFLEDGLPPVVISFGSMGGSDGKKITEILIDAIKQTNQRAVIQSGWGLLGTQDATSNIFCTEYVPHRWLFPKASCVVHHGGAGTTASVCYAKVASIVVPHFGDQLYWGKQLSALGVAPRSLPRRNLTAKRLAQRIEKVLETPTMKKRAQALGTKMASEDGLTTAVEMIESF